MPLTDPDRLFPISEKPRALARELYQSIADFPIISPHGHCDPRWFAKNERFSDPAQLFVVPDHYVCRMLISRGVAPQELGLPCNDGRLAEGDPRTIWRRFAQNFHLFRGTPSGMWLNHSFEHEFGIDEPLTKDTAEECYDTIDAKLSEEEFHPRALFEKFNIECLATTEGALDELQWHEKIKSSGWDGKVVTTYRPDTVIDPSTAGFSINIEKLGQFAGEDATTWEGYLAAHRSRRAFFKSYGATATDHGHPTAQTSNLPLAEAKALFAKVLKGNHSEQEAEVFRGQMLTEMALMSLDDGLTMQIHPGSWRNHSDLIYELHGRDMGFDIPKQAEFVKALKPMLDVVGLERDLTIIIFMLDETTLSRELAPLAGAYPALRLGPPWWFLDSAEGMRRFREYTTETCGFYNTVGFNDDTRAFCSIPARHDVARRVDAAFLAQLVCTGRLEENEAFDVARELAYDLVKEAYGLGG